MEKVDGGAEPAGPRLATAMFGKAPKATPRLLFFIFLCPDEVFDAFKSFFLNIQTIIKSRTTRMW